MLAGSILWSLSEVKAQNYRVLFWLALSHVEGRLWVKSAIVRMKVINVALDPSRYISMVVCVDVGDSGRTEKWWIEVAEFISWVSLDAYLSSLCSGAYWPCCRACIVSVSRSGYIKSTPCRKKHTYYDVNTVNGNENYRLSIWKCWSQRISGVRIRSEFFSGKIAVDQGLLVRGVT